MQKITIRISNKLNNKLMKLASNSSKSHTIRKLIKDANSSNIVTHSIANKVYSNICNISQIVSHVDFNLTEIGNNVNQIAKVLNQGKRVPINNPLVDAKNAVQTATTSIISNQRKIIHYIKEMR